MNSNPESILKLTYTSRWESQGRGTGFIYGETIPEQTITMDLPDPDELTSIQLLRWFTQYLGAMGHSTRGIQKGLAECLFQEGITKEEQEWLSEEYDLTFNEDLDKYYKERKEAEEEWARLEKSMNEKLAESFRGPMETVITTEESTNA